MRAMLAGHRRHPGRSPSPAPGGGKSDGGGSGGLAACGEYVAKLCPSIYDVPVDHLRCPESLNLVGSAVFGRLLRRTHRRFWVVFQHLAARLTTDEQRLP